MTFLIVTISLGSSTTMVEDLTMDSMRTAVVAVVIIHTIVGLPVSMDALRAPVGLHVQTATDILSLRGSSVWLVGVLVTWPSNVIC